MAILGERVRTSKSGNDYIEGGTGMDDIFGDHSLASQAGNVTPGEDILYGGTGDDLLFGGGETDYLYGEDGDDALDGGEGEDFFYGDFANTSLGSGMDFLFDDDTDPDEMYGCGGDDLLWSLNADPQDSLDGNGGTDTAWYDGGSPSDTPVNIAVVGTGLTAPHNVGPDGYTEFLFGASLSDNFVHKLSESPQTNSFWTNAYAGTRSP